MAALPTPLTDNGEIKVATVKKLVDQEDLRCKPIAITEKGRQAVQLIDDVFETLDHGMYRGFSDEEKQMIAGFYQRILDNLDFVSAGGM